MKLSEFDYNLPEELIARKPANPRDHSRLLIFDKKTEKLEHKHFYDILNYFQAGDVLVMNNSKVFPARLIGAKEESGGRVEVFMHHFKEGKVWQCLIGGKKVKPGLKINFNDNFYCEVLKNNQDSTWDVEFNLEYDLLMEKVYENGKIPLPPYIKIDENEDRKDKENYQTVFADDGKVGSVAAPTAGLHFTDELLEKLKEKGVILKYITLHVGLGTFSSVKTENIEEHEMHAEWVEVEDGVINEIVDAKNENRRVITVGTTSTRTLEAIFQDGSPTLDSGQVLRTWVNIFIYPGYEFRVVDGIITNFHLPKSSLIMLVSAFTDIEKIRNIYETAIKEKYRFYSYGDAMFLI